MIFHSYRSNGQRLVIISFSVVSSDASDAEDVEIGCAKTCAPCVPCAPAAEAQPAEEGAERAGDTDSSLLGGQAEPSSDFVGLGAAGNRRIPGGSLDPL